MAKEKNIFDQLVDFLSSVKLALVLLLVLAVAAIGGTIVPQNLPHEQYLRGYGPELYTFLSYLDMFDMYDSWWFELLLGFLVVNLLVCSARRLPKTIKLAKTGDPGRNSPDFLTRQSFSRTIALDGASEETFAAARDLFQNHFGRIQEKERPWGKLIYGQKGAFSRFGAYVVHASLLFFVAGGLVGGIWGYSARLQLNEGETANVAFGQKPPGPIELPFSVKLDKFIIKFYKNGQPSEYRSQVTLSEEGQDVKKGDILVNHPLIYRGITIYQSHYGQASGQKISVRVTRKSDGRAFDLSLSLRAPVELPDGETLIAWLEFSEDLMGAGPAAKLIIQQKEGEPYGAWAFLNRPEFVPRSDGAFTFDLKAYELKYYSGLLVNKDPGVPLIWIGCGVMFVGFLITFLFAHQKMFLGMISENNRPRLMLAGTSHRNRGAFQNRFDRLAAEMEKLGNGDDSV